MIRIANEQAGDNGARKRGVREKQPKVYHSFRSTRTRTSTGQQEKKSGEVTFCLSEIFNDLEFANAFSDSRIILVKRRL